MSVVTNVPLPPGYDAFLAMVLNVARTPVPKGAPRLEPLVCSG